jgi:transitional endoplasmic reticulum ATPase
MSTFQIPRRIQSLVFKRRKPNALFHLNKYISDLDTGLYSEYYSDYIRFLHLYRIRLLLDWGMHKDALAYVCLENELYPDNPNSFAYKEFLKARLPQSHSSKDTVLTAQSRGWDGVAGMEELKAIFERDVILPFTQKALYEKYKVPLPNGILLFGPPGCGKTYVAQKLAEQVSFNFIEIKPSSLGSTYVHGTQIEIKKLFEEAEKKRPTLIFIDEIEALVPNRSDSNVSFHYKAEVNEFLTQLDNCHKRGILVVGATNLIRNIDPAILRPGRFDQKIFVGPPDLEARVDAFKIHMKERPQEESIKWLYLAEMAEYFTFAEISNVVNQAARIAIDKKCLINTNILGSVIEKTKPALNENNINQYT